MEWKSVLMGLIIGVLIAVPYSLAHSGVFEREDKNPWRGFGLMTGMGHGMGMHMGMMNEGMHEEMERYMENGNFTEIHEEMEEDMEATMEKYMGEGWKEMHEYCERMIGIEDE
ncbi:hypothetical protein [Pyrococcus yayanosii]|uniref:Uncharacterized protein n=1 Tax=Pyrococcus yayanosii (strain CH1 / JCM 16557) TaxID=529709 RepID=F8AJB0_PYRYC|nr:hypothetical protein [Pyrococcus yayanosii]AEH24556.1 hypothetical protein PYCH_08710 [Pyrococcus yayanosii CH1]